MNNPKNPHVGDGVPDVPKNSKEREKLKKITHKAKQAAVQMRMQSHSLGSYTGTAHDGGTPQQDADDL